MSDMEMSDMDRLMIVKRRVKSAFEEFMSVPSYETEEKLKLWVDEYRRKQNEMSDSGRY